MNQNSLLLAAANFGLIGVLPWVFFRPGRFNRMWLLTSFPFVLSGGSIVAGTLGILPDFWPPAETPGNVCSAAAMLVFATAFLLIGMTLGSHRIPLALWHQADDTPRHIVTWGAYARLRHPFYTSFLLTLVGSFLLAPNWGTLAAFAAGFAMLNATASREEKRLCTSDFQSEYADYLGRTGRFIPRFAGRHEVRS
jgi:protein-S-isoprenylcysteine O-methyltransferase Ste14